MKPLYRLLLFSFLLFIAADVFAQAKYDVTGIVTNEKKEPIKGATVFIGGSERVTATGDDGRFKFTGVPQGTFQLSVQVLGYAPQSRNIIVKAAAVYVDIQLIAKTIDLGAVAIGKKSAWENNFKIFTEAFLGESANAKQCVIVNPKVINFSTKKGLLLADADDFLIIENKRLGYRLHYQLEDFGYNSADDIALYHGECSFEELDGTDEQKKQWAKNRLEAYQGSFMHFLRSVYTNKVMENGFITRPLYGYGTVRYDPTTEDRDKLIINERPVMFDSLVATIDPTFKSLKFNQLYVIYDPLKARNFFVAAADKKNSIIIDKKASILKLASSEAVIDKKGSYTDYRDFYIHGNWAKARVADQLPVEYLPPVAPLIAKDYPTDKLVAGLQRWTDSLPQEKIYLHMDKPCYTHGDTIWFKGYVTTGSRHELSGISGAVYAELINEQNQLIKTLKLPVAGGTVKGNFILGDDLKDGSYRIRAYTQWMRNAGEDYFFDQAFNVGNVTKAEKETDNRTALQKTDLQFFPEGGNLINGIVSKVGFKAIGISGMGAALSGEILDNDNKETAQIKTLHAGMGSFLLTPLAGKTYMAHIRLADGTAKNIPLPKALDEGYVLSVYQPDKDSILVRIRASATLQSSTVYLVAHSSGETISALPVVINSAVSSVWLDKKSFPSGIAQFTLFNTDYEPLNERIVFIKSDDQMKLTVKAAKPTYQSREHVQVDLEANNSSEKPAPGSFSVAVIDASRVPVDESAESTIFSHILLSADIKGYVEKPNYYFSSDTGEVNLALDNLMLTQGYRRFDWKMLNETVNTKPVYEAEGLASVISGLVTTLTKKPLANATVKMMSIRAGVMKDTVTDSYGRFKFDKLLLGDSLKITVQARDADNTDKVILTLDNIPQIKLDPDKSPTNKKEAVTIIATKAKPQKAEQENQTIVQVKTQHVLKQVDIKAKEVNKADKDIVAQDMFQIPEESVDRIITIPNPDSYNNLTMFLRGTISGVNILTDSDGYHRLVSTRAPREKFYRVHTPRDVIHDPYIGRTFGVIVNGRKILDKGEIDEILEGSILPEDVAKIEVVKTNRALVESLRGMNDDYLGYILIFTKLPSARKQYLPNMANIMPKGFNKVRKFYSPRYNVQSEGEKQQPDLRTTIYWNPDLKTDINGKASFDFFNADGPATYRVVVEGINANGELGRTVYRYAVE